MSSQQKSFSSIRYAPVQGPPSKRYKFLEHGWHYEGISIATSFLCTAAIIAILVRMNNNPLSSWKFNFSLNATIAALITAAQSTAIFSVASCQSQSKWLHFKKSARKLYELELLENASRGPWGSLVVLLRVRWRLGLIAGTGAMATILALGIHTSAQQLVGFDSRGVEVDRDAAFGLNYIYDGGTQADFSHGGPFYPKTSTADVGMQGAIYKGIFNINATAVFRCSSTCVWKGSYVTLGFSSSCSDVTSNTTINQTSQGYSVTTPHGISLTADYAKTDYQTVVNVVAVDLTMTLNPNSSYNAFWVPAEFVRVAVLKAPVMNPINNVIDPNTMQIFECTVGFSGYSYTNISASGNHFAINNQDLITLNPGFYTQAVVVFNQTGLPVMKARAPDIGAIAQFFTSDRFSGAIYNGESVPVDPSGVGVALRNADIAKAFRNMAQSMTDQLRSGYNVTAAGSTINSVPFVQVHWAWIILPLFVQAVSGLLLALTTSSSRNHHVRLWKSSTVAVLYHDVVLEGDSMGTLRTDIQDPEQMEDLAKRMRARLE